MTSEEIPLDLHFGQRRVLLSHELNAFYEDVSTPEERESMGDIIFSDDRFDAYSPGVIAAFDGWFCARIFACESPHELVIMAEEIQRFRRFRKEIRLNLLQNLSRKLDEMAP